MSRITLTTLALGVLISLAQSAVFAASENFSRGYQSWDQGEYATARRYLSAAAKAGDLNAQNHLGQMEEDGQGSTVNLNLAVRWYRQAAEAGHPAAQLNLGRMYRSGKGVTQDDRRAVAWYRKAADQGLSIAQFFMGLMYDTGKGVSSDYAKAYKWFDLAARQGDEDARYKRDRLARQMTPGQILQAERLAATFLGEAAPTGAASTTQQGGLELAMPTGLKPLTVASIRPATQAALVPATPVTSTNSTALTKSELIEMQQILNSLGYHAGTLDGNPGGRTAKAITLYRRDTEQAGDTSLDSGLLAELQYTQSNLGSRASRPTDPKQLVKRIQSALNRLEYEAGTADGVIGSRTIAAARKYRANLGYKVRDELTHGLLRVTETRLAVIAHARANGTRARVAAEVARTPTQVRVLSATQITQRGGVSSHPPEGSELVKRLQKALSERGFDSGPVDGAIGERTRSAVRNYQTSAGLEPDGRLTVSLLSQLEGAEAQTEKNGPHLRFVRPASQRELARRAQVRLNSLGYDAGAPDGLPGQKTTSAITNFQHRARLRADGRLTEALLRRLEHPDAEKPAGRRTDLTGAPLVRQIQAELNRVGYPAGAADGIIGRRTVDAAKSYQKAVGVTQTGTLTPGLLQSLRAAR